MLETRIKNKMDNLQKETISSKQQKFQRDKIDYVTGCYRNWKKPKHENDKYKSNKDNNPKNYSHKIPQNYR
ncbi:hypothetical protein FKM82_023104 [Ascaphus truei]